MLLTFPSCRVFNISRNSRSFHTEVIKYQSSKNYLKEKSTSEIVRSLAVLRLSSFEKFVKNADKVINALCVKKTSLLINAIHQFILKFL